MCNEMLASSESEWVFQRQWLFWRKMGATTKDMRRASWEVLCEKEEYTEGVEGV